jgi:ketosteroid isomerase-like protein
MIRSKPTSMLAALFAAVLLLQAGCAAVEKTEQGFATLVRAEDLAVAERQVRNHESDFARSMAERNFANFHSFLSEEAVFFSGAGGAESQRGKAAVAAHWKRWFDSPAAPFAWAPEKIEVLDSGTLALSTGPVYDASGRQIATFTTIWRKEGPARWRVIFDKGCNCASR